MRPSLLGLGLLVPKTLGHLVIETVWVGTGDCSPTRGVGGSGVEGSDDRFGTETFAYTSTSSNGMVTDGIETSVYIITPAAVGSGAGGSSDRFGTEKLAHTSSSSNVIFTSGIETPISPIIPASIASEASTVLVTSNNSNSAVTISITTSSTYPIIFTTASPQLGPLTVGTGTTTTRNSPGSTVEPTNTNVSITTGIGTSTYPTIQVSAASGTATVVIASTNSNSTVTTSTNTSSAYPIISRTGSPQPGSVTVGTNIKTTKNTETANSGTPGGSKNGGLAISSTDTRSSPTATPSPATNGSPGTTMNSGAEPTYSNINPTCSDNNTYYVDIFGIQYGIRCGLDFANPDGVSLKTHADTFEGCIQYCSLLKDCGGVRFSGTDCYPIATFRGYKAETADAGNDLLTAIPTNGASSGEITPDDLCAEGFDGQPFTDVFQCTWNIVCNQTIAGTALQPTIQTNFEACIYYCAFYDGCESVYFQGDGSSESIGEVEAVANCFPMSSIGAVSQDTLVSAASLNGTCNWPANQ